MPTPDPLARTISRTHPVAAPAFQAHLDYQATAPGPARDAAFARYQTLWHTLVRFRRGVPPPAILQALASPDWPDSPQPGITLWRQPAPKIYTGPNFWG